MMKASGSSIIRKTGYETYFDAFVENNDDYSPTKEEQEESTLRQGLPYIMFLSSPVLFIIFLAARKSLGLWTRLWITLWYSYRNIDIFSLWHYSFLKVNAQGWSVLAGVPFEVICQPLDKGWEFFPQGISEVKHCHRMDLFGSFNSSIVRFWLGKDSWQ